jgi:uncharacterized ferritin-like protein (DUF455 family)
MRVDGNGRGFAWRVLSSTTLEDKLRPPDPSDDHRSPPARLPSVPARPAALAFAPRSAAPPLPSPRALSTDRDRARILHAMANHELLALELFAWAILRFPELPPAHRRAFVRTMVDEQRHCAAYVERLRAAGGEVGEEPVSTFFWDALAPIGDARGLVAGLALCLEQANLDFARVWAAAFRRVGDATTAEVLDAVHADEIRHLRAGVATFRALSPDPRASLTWEGFRAALVPPMSPARARGPSMDREGRAAAGLSPAFVDALAAAGGSRGRVPRLAVLRAGAEDELAGRAAATPPALASLGALLVSAEDLVLAPPPRPAFLARLAARGWPVPAFVAPGSALPRIAGVVPWAVTPSLARAFPDHVPAFDPRRAEVHGKAFAAALARELFVEGALGARAEDLGVICRDEAAVAVAVGDRRAVVKADLSTAGGQRVWVDGPWSAAPPAARGFLARALAAGPVVVEPALPVVAELSVHADVGEDEVRVRDVTRFWATRGVYRGTLFGPLAQGADRALARFLHGDGADRDAVARELGRVARAVGAAARARGHRGPLSVDALVLQGEDGALRLKPLSEINPRVTMSRLALAARERLAPGAVGLWWFLPAAALARAGLDPEALEAWLPAEARDGRPSRGVLATTDPTDGPLTTWLWFSPRWSEVADALARLVDAHPSLGAHLPPGLTAPRDPARPPPP